MRSASFPTDWIAPGEFMYGPSGCGNELVMGPVWSKRRFMGRRVAQVRYALAWVRKSLGYPPLWWVKDGSWYVDDPRWAGSKGPPEGGGGAQC
jgi:hypothetical protein